jgi:hypothetical protein
MENDRLAAVLQANIGRAERNQYNLEVFLALARFMGHHWRLFLDLEQAENQLKDAQNVGLSGTPQQTIAQLMVAYRTVERSRDEGKSAFANLQVVFEKSRYPKGRSVNGRDFVHVFDDVKDHFADRRPDLGYMAAPEESADLDSWLKELARVMRVYSQLNGLPAPAVSEQP